MWNMKIWQSLLILSLGLSATTVGQARPMTEGGKKLMLEMFNRFEIDQNECGDLEQDKAAFTICGEFGSVQTNGRADRNGMVQIWNACLVQVGAQAGYSLKPVDAWTETREGKDRVIKQHFDFVGGKLSVTVRNAETIVLTSTQDPAVRSQPAQPSKLAPYCESAEAWGTDDVVLSLETNGLSSMLQRSNDTVTLDLSTAPRPRATIKGSTATQTQSTTGGNTTGKPVAEPKTPGSSVSVTVDNGPASTATPNPVTLNPVTPNPVTSGGPVLAPFTVRSEFPKPAGPIKLTEYGPALQQGVSYLNLKELATATGAKLEIYPLFAELKFAGLVLTLDVGSKIAQLEQAGASNTVTLESAFTVKTEMPLLPISFASLLGCSINPAEAQTLNLTCTIDGKSKTVTLKKYNTEPTN
jgi:hypothetical protein